MPLTLVSSQRLFEGWQKRYSHQAQSTACDMTFSIYLPPQTAQGKKVPVLYWLSGLTCSDENFSTKAGAQRVAAELGMALVIPDTSPRGDDVADDAAYDLGKGAGFYLNATQEPWRAHFRMYDYIVKELPELIEAHFPVTEQRAISGHSMGGHGALTIGLKNPERYTSISAFSPICNPCSCPWGEKAFAAYLGEARQDWEQYDATLLLEKLGVALPIKISQGSEDSFLKEQLKPEALLAAARRVEVEVDYQLCEGYDHSYYFISTFIEAHLRFHHAHLLAG
ncbi:S-formylglutathione hydrolase [Pokkaliibacter sp. MBI-7]|uniref:S-formylglutathione hydrolase n=1 Tax=Pokkaliibacter sp. MBI-7 TaxID=3040600 RepID=UPI00244B1635|nr:S-formylglutathione hydrolase [Pokkaliibacter sp. MBI-7]MDH2433677.1 S-formylglutathione hydrolase [Pokkaliibacter sp. MBI-7]